MPLYGILSDNELERETRVPCRLPLRAAKLARGMALSGIAPFFRGGWLRACMFVDVRCEGAAGGPMEWDTDLDEVMAGCWLGREGRKNDAGARILPM